MAEEQFGERTEPATPRKREEARRRGQVSRSVDLSSAVLLLVAVLALALFGRTFLRGTFDSTRAILENLHALGVDRDDLLAEYGGYLIAILGGLAPLLLLLLVAGLAINLLQVGFVFSSTPLTPDLDRLNPFSGIRRIFSVRGLVRLLQGLFKLAVIGTVGAVTIWGERHQIVRLLDREMPEIVQYLLEVLFVLSIRMVLALLILAILDFGYQRWQFERDLRMSRQEIREELKRYEGDPKIKERRRAVQRQLALQRMMQRVPRATVVITNPTEFAVALEYRAEEMDAPVVAAKGADHLARRIREVALENGVPIVQRPEVARMLYRAAEVGQPIPVDLYQAVAEILAYVYRLKGAVA